MIVQFATWGISRITVIKVTYSKEDISLMMPLIASTQNTIPQRLALYIYIYDSKEDLFSVTDLSNKKKKKNIQIEKDMFLSSVPMTS